MKPSPSMELTIYVQIQKILKIIESADFVNEGSPARPVDSM